MTGYEAKVLEAAKAYRAAAEWSRKCDAAEEDAEEDAEKRVAEAKRLARDATDAAVKASTALRRAAREADV